MIDSISQSLNAIQDISSRQLSEKQSTVVNDIISNYDPKNLSAEHASSIVEQFNEQGIRPSKSLRDTLQASGFDGRKIADLAGVELPSRAELRDTISQQHQDPRSTFSVTV